MAIDPVCKMKVDERIAALKSEYEGKTYYFCNQSCKTTFDKSPTKYTGNSGGRTGHSCCCGNC